MDNREYLANAAAAVPTRPVAPSGGYPQGGATPTKLGAYWFHQMGEEMRAILVAAGVAPDGAVLSQLQQAVKRLAGSNVTVISYTQSPFTLTADHAGVVVIDASAGNVLINLPRANAAAAAPLQYAFAFVSGNSNTATVVRAGLDVVEGLTQLALSQTSNTRSILRSDGNGAWFLIGTSTSAQAYQTFAGRAIGLPTDTNLQTWAESAPAMGVYNLQLTTPQNGLPVGWWYIDLKTHVYSGAGGPWRALEARSMGAGNLSNLIYINTNVSGGPASGTWSGWQQSGLRAASTGEAQSQSDNTVSLTPLSLALAFQGANQSLSASGFQRLPGGLILQYGITPIVGASGSAAMALPIVFPNNVFAAFAAPIGQSTDGGAAYGLSTRIANRGNLVFYNNGTYGPTNGNFIAIGN